MAGSDSLDATSAKASGPSEPPGAPDDRTVGRGDTAWALGEEYEYLHGGPPGDPVAGESALEHYRRMAIDRKQAALCLSGGGIRSAAFSLGVLQSLARRQLLERFHYLSTVSGGGYTGSWLSAWLKEAGHDVKAVQSALAGTSKAPEAEPVRWLREYSNFITPSVGLASGDTWAALAIVVRNLLLNWLIFLPALLALVAVPNLYLAAMRLATKAPEAWGLGASLAIILAAVVCFGIAACRSCTKLPSYDQFAKHTSGSRSSQAKLVGRPGSGIFYQVSSLSLAGAMLLPLGLAPALDRTGAGLDALAGFMPGNEGLALAVLAAAAAFVGFLVAYEVARGRVEAKRGPNAQARREIGFRRNRIVWLLASLSGSAAMALGAYLALPDAGACDRAELPFRCLYEAELAAIFAPFWLILCQVLITAIFVGFRRTDQEHGGINSRIMRLLRRARGRETAEDKASDMGRPGRLAIFPDLDREWLARLSGQKILSALLWLVFASTALMLPRLVLDQPGVFWNWLSGAVAAVSGLAVALGGKSSASSGPAGTKKGLRARLTDNALAVATLVFTLALIMILARTEANLAGWVLQQVTDDPTDMLGERSGALMLVHGLLLVVLARAAWWAATKINVNRFSLNGLYRNRLSRAFLGAARKARVADAFTGFDPADNPRMMALKRDLGERPKQGQRLLHVVNVALNVVGGTRLAWQERKAMAFTITPLACGSALLDRFDGHRPSQEPPTPSGAYVRSALYAGSEPDLDPSQTGISLATAMTISGAAASPSMGYHTSTATSILMTLLNVRLGAWLPNPANKTLSSSAMLKSHPANALMPLFDEMLGRTDQYKDYVYLSDGGHFENLGIYEMIRRRCRYIVVSDAGCDPRCHFEDLGNAVRKVFIDQGVRIEFQDVEIDARGSDKAKLAYAIGRITYPEKDRDGREEQGVILYLKPSFLGGAPMDVRAYAEANGEFPHQSTGDQWFSESQFESYRRLGEHLMDELFGKELPGGGPPPPALEPRGVLLAWINGPADGAPKPPSPSGRKVAVSPEAPTPERKAPSRSRSRGEPGKTDV